MKFADFTPPIGLKAGGLGGGMIVYGTLEE